MKISHKNTVKNYKAVQNAWNSYLDQCFPIDEISEVVIYTDSMRYWLAKGLADAATVNNWKVSVSVLNETTEEDMTDIAQSLSFLRSSTLLVGIFSDQNPTVDLINQVFNPLQSPSQFNGFILISLQSFPDQYFPHFLAADYNSIINDQEYYLSQLRKGSKVVIKSNRGTDLQFVLSSNAAMFSNRVSQQSRHILFPATEIITEIIPSSVEGTLVVDGVIGRYYEDLELIDPFGKVFDPIYIEIEDGSISKIEGDDWLANRLGIFIYII
ncbi:MAG: hypothetical protein ACXAB7_17125 [Candidatus Kariarchaeaceae archaeon]